MEKKKLNYKTVLVASALFIAIFAQVGFLGSVLGPVGQQHNIWGTTAKAGNSPPGLDISTNRMITAWIDGVTYGNNLTEVSGEYDLYVDGDDWGVDEDNALKDGGWDGDLIYYFLDYDPMDYYLNIASHTSTFDTSAYELKDPIYFDTQTIVDNLVDTYLRGIKINEVVVDPGDGYPDYVILYDSGSELSLAALTDENKGYYLEKDDPDPTSPPDPQGQIFEFSANPLFVEVLSPNYYYINLTGFDLGNSADELKLVWKNPANWGTMTPTVDGICDDTDVIVDRVEWGNHINHIHLLTPPDDRDYDNTTMGDFQFAPSTGESMIRTTNGTDTDHCDIDFMLQAVRTPRPAGLPAQVDYVLIRDQSGDAGTNFCDPAKYPSYPVGQTITFYGAGYNDTAGFVGQVGALSTWLSYDITLVTVVSPGMSSLITCDNVNWGGPTTIELTDTDGHINTTEITILEPTVDYITIVDTAGTGANEILDQGVGGGFTIEGWAAGFNNTAGYLNDVSVTWSVTNITSVATTAPLSGVSSIFNAGGVAGTATWEADDGAGHKDTVVFTITISGGVPGAPTDLRVHKGGESWGGIAGDLVLEWLAPSSDYGNLTLNIVYYDMDLSDGFQYTNWILFTPNNTGAGTPDGCILPGWDADSNNYAFIVRTTGDTQGNLENPTGTNIGYKYIMTLQKTGPTLTNTRWVSLPYISDLKKEEDIAGSLGEFTDNQYIEKVSRWNYATQKYEHRKWVPFPTGHWEGNFTIEPGDAVAVQITTSSPYEWSIVGAYDDSLVFSLIKTAPVLTNSKWLSLPYHKAYLDFEDIANNDAEFTDNSVIEKVSKWDYATQAYEHRKWVPFPTGHWEGNPIVPPSPGEAILFQITRDITPYPYTPEVIGL